MDVRLPDGTIIQNVPEGTTKADLVGRLQSAGMAIPADWLGDVPKAPPTDRQRLLASAPMRLAKGMKDPIDGVAQFASNAVDAVGRVLPATALLSRLVKPSEMVNKAADAIGGEGTFLGDVAGIKGATPQQMQTDLQRSEAEYQGARKATGQQGADVARFAGNVLSPVNAALGDGRRGGCCGAARHG
jgi:hypothetical protein